MQKPICLAAMLLMFTPMSALADDPDQGWNCRNTDVEITCGDGSCKVSDAFTPMDVHLSGNRLTVAAYSGVWEGDATVSRNGALIYAFSKSLKWSGGETGSGAVFQLAINGASRLAVILGGRFAHPMHCEPWQDPGETNSGQ